MLHWSEEESEPEGTGGPHPSAFRSFGRDCSGSRQRAQGPGAGRSAVQRDAGLIQPHSAPSGVVSAAVGRSPPACRPAGPAAGGRSGLACWPRPLPRPRPAPPLTCQASSSCVSATFWRIVRSSSRESESRSRETRLSSRDSSSALQARGAESGSEGARASASRGDGTLLDPDGSGAANTKSKVGGLLVGVELTITCGGIEGPGAAVPLGLWWMVAEAHLFTASSRSERAPLRASSGSSCVRSSFCLCSSSRRDCNSARCRLICGQGMVKRGREAPGSTSSQGFRSLGPPLPAPQTLGAAAACAGDESSSPQAGAGWGGGRAGWMV